ncbi:MAG: HIT family hydrolase [Leptospira sp.]|jgi:diadenosine tetraphosphate (Ap4A) HIT family hydrolase|nr:HIT family hydrolase [Leptospira sp.]
MITCPICNAHKLREGIIVESEHWIVRKAPDEKNLEGYCYLESKSHTESWFSLSMEACKDFGNILHLGLAASLTLPESPEKIYFTCISEAVPHLHMHMVPRYKHHEKGISHLEKALGPGFSKPL